MTDKNDANRYSGRRDDLHSPEPMEDNADIIADLLFDLDEILKEDFSTPGESSFTDHEFSVPAKDMDYPRKGTYVSPREPAQKKTAPVEREEKPSDRREKKRADRTEKPSDRKDKAPADRAENPSARKDKATTERAENPSAHKDKAPADRAEKPSAGKGKKSDERSKSAPKPTKEPARPKEAKKPAPAAERESEVKTGFNPIKLLKRVLSVFLVTVLLIVGGLYGVMYILTKGPSPTARNMFVRSVRETSAIKFLANWYLTDEEIADIYNTGAQNTLEETDTSLVSTDTVHSGTEPDAWGFVDEDGDGIIIDPVKGEGYIGYMMIVLDPSRVIMGSVTEDFGLRGYTVEEMVKHFDAVAGTNAGGFEDLNGTGNGSYPDSCVVFDGEMFFDYKGVGQGFVGFDDNYILHVGFDSVQAVKDANIQYGCCFGPVLVSNGEGVDPELLASGVNPRTAIGQRSDGAVLLLVIDGRQVISLGASYADEMEIMLRYGAVNACNLDGGSSSLMYYKDAYVNNCASVIGIRPVPTSFLVMKEGAKINGN